MNEPQTWTIIGLLFTTQVFLITLVLRTIKAEIIGLRGEITGSINTLSVQVEHLDREVVRLVEWRFKGEGGGV